MNYYEILGIKKTATDEEIKAAYKNLVKKYHPDIYKGDKNFAEKKIKEINNAYDTLSNAELKKEYDAEINPQPQQTYSTSHESTNTSHSNSYYSYTKQTHYNTYRTSYNTSTSQYRPNTSTSYSNKYSDYIFNKVDNLKKKNKILIVLGIMFFYLTIFLISLFQLYTFISPSDDKNSTQQTQQNESRQETPTILPNDSDEIDNYYVYKYFNDEQLQQLYEYIYKDSYNSYEEFLNDYSEYLIEQGY